MSMNNMSQFFMDSFNKSGHKRKKPDSKQNDAYYDFLSVVILTTVGVLAASADSIWKHNSII